MWRAGVPQKTLKISIIAIVALTVAVAWGQEQVILRVPQDLPTVEEAIAVAPPGATIRIAEGTYRVQLVLDKDLTLEGSSDTVTLRASNLIEPIVRVQGSAHVTLRRLILDDSTRSLIVQDDAVVSLEGSQVRDATLAGVLVRDQGQLRCVHSKITGNHGRAGITTQDQAQLVLEACIVQGNESKGVFVMGQARLEARQSLFERNRDAALALSDDAHAVVTASRFTANDGLGVQLQGRSRLLIEGSEFFSNIDQRRGQGILVEESAHLEATRVRFLSEKLGVALEGKATASIRECEFVGDSGIAVTSDGALITIESNLFRKGKQGVAIASQGTQAKVLVRKNAFEDLVAFLQDSYAVEISGQATVAVEGNTFERNLVAIALKSTQNVTVRDNAFFDNYIAMDIQRSRAVVEDNTFERNWFGLSIGGREGEVSLRKNRLTETENSAITVRGTAKVTIANTQITEGKGLGIALLEEAHAILQSNTLRGGKPHGIVVSGLAQVSLQGNRISEYSGCALYVGPKAKLVRDENNDLHGNQAGELCGRVGNSWQARLEQAPPGAVLEIPPGVYYESLWVNKSIEIRSSGAVFHGNTLDPVIVVTGNATVRLEGITLQEGIAGVVATDEPPYGNWFPGLIAEPGQQQLELRAVKILANGNAGIWADSRVTKLVVERSELRDNGQYGIRFHGVSLSVVESTIAGHETGLFANLPGREQASVTIARTSFSDNQLGVDARGLGELTVESSQITGGALGVWVHGMERGVPSGQALRVHIARSLIRDHRQERVASFTLALLAIFSGEFVGSGLALEGQAEVTLIDNEITENEIHGVAIGQQSSVILERNTITKNEKYGVALEITACMKGLAVPQRFEGHIEGKQNTVPSPGEPNANLKGAFCPKELELLRTEQGGSYP